MSASNSPVKTSWIQMAAAGGDHYDAYLALPPSGRGPGLVLFQEIFGVNEHIRALVEQYALDGYVVLAPDVFWRQQRRLDVGYEGADRQRGIELMGQTKPAELETDIVAAVKALRGLAFTGNSFARTVQTAVDSIKQKAYAAAGVDAAVAYYGGGIPNMVDEKPKCPVMLQFHYAEHDDNIPPAAVDKVRTAMHGKSAEVHVYPGAMHGFNCWARASYHAPSAALAHGRSLQFLAQLF